MRVVGVRNYAGKEARAASALHNGAAVSIQHEPRNGNDPNAHVVVCESYKLGYVPRFAAQLMVTAGVPSPLVGSVALVRPCGKSLEIRLDVVTRIDTAPSKYALTSATESASGIYAIVNVSNMRAYIGRAQDMEQRRRQHLLALQRGTHASPNLQVDWRRNPGQFAFVVVMPASMGDLEKEEIYYLKAYGTNHPALGYNQGEGFTPHPPQRDATKRPRRRRLRVTRNPLDRDRTSKTPTPIRHPIAGAGLGNTSRPPPKSSSGSVRQGVPPTPKPAGCGCVVILVLVPLSVCVVFLCVVLTA